MSYAAIKSIEYYLPEAVLTNSQLEELYPDFSAEKIFSKTGIRERHISASNEFSSDMAIKAANKLFENYAIDKSKIDCLIFCTQTPDYMLPTNACIIQCALGLSKYVGAFDINLGCSGYIYGLSIAKGLVESNQAINVLLLTADTYSKLIESTDKSVRTIFGDGATATLISKLDSSLGHQEAIAPIMYGTDGSGWLNLCVKGRGLRHYEDMSADPFLRMQGAEIFRFTLDAIPELINRLLLRENLTLNDIDLFVFHQANQFILEHLRKKIGIPLEKLILFMESCGNTVSSTIPIVLKEALIQNKLIECKKVMLVGFGVGYSWAGTIIDATHII